MARLVLAAVIVLVIVAFIAVVVAGLYRIARTGGSDVLGAGGKATGMQQVAFFLLMALILYVSVTGGS